MNCKNCQAPNPGLLCEYCGTPNGIIASAEEEYAALESLKRAYARAGQEGGQLATAANERLDRFVATMWVPNSPDARFRTTTWLLTLTDAASHKASKAVVAKLDAIKRLSVMEHPVHPESLKLVGLVDSHAQMRQSSERRERAILLITTGTLVGFAAWALFR